MSPVIIQLGSFSLRWYGMMAALGYLMAMFVLQRRRKVANLSSDQVYDLAFIALTAGIIGARVFYVIRFWDQFKNNLLEIIRVDHGGLVFYGGFICAMLSLVVYSRRNKLSLLSILDIYAPAMALGHVFGRIGCLFNGCCYGKTCDLPWSITYSETYAKLLPFDALGLSRHPVQLYEAIGNFIIFAILYRLLGKQKQGQTAASYLLLYGLLRFSDEFLRGDHKHFFLGLFTPAQSICLFLILPLGALLFYYCSRKPLQQELIQSEAEEAIK